MIKFLNHVFGNRVLLRVAIFATRNAVPKQIANRIVCSVNAVIDVNPVAVFSSAIARNLARRASAIKARLRCNFFELVCANFKRKSAINCAALIPAKKMVHRSHAVGLPDVCVSFVNFARALSIKAAARFCSPKHQRRYTELPFCPAIAPTKVKILGASALYKRQYSNPSVLAPNFFINPF